MFTLGSVVRNRVRFHFLWPMFGFFALSAPIDPGATAAEPDWSRLLISEIHYHPATSNAIDGDEYEFIELMNSGTMPLDLRGLSFTGIGAAFLDSLVVEPGGCVVLAHDPVRFAERYPYVHVNGTYSGRLDNSGETIALISPTAGVITSVNYKDNAPWPVEADGSGPSLQRINTSLDASFARNWKALPPTPGTPVSSEWIDTDADGMPDYWELAHGFDQNDPTDAVGDADGDLLSNAGEFLAGTDPRNAAECLRFTSVNFEQTPNYRIIELTFPAAANHTYSLYLQVGGNDCWNSVGYFGARATNRVETVRQVINPGPTSFIFHLGSPARPPPACEGGGD
jgi:hypothetical protein